MVFGGLCLYRQPLSDSQAETKADVPSASAGDSDGGVAMIVHKTWKTYDRNFRLKYIYKGYFLFGIIPLIIWRVSL